MESGRAGVPVAPGPLRMDQPKHRGQPSPDLLTGKPAFAFCGLGNPASFYQTLGELGVKLAGSREFPDHHRYERQEIDQILANAAELGATPVTTAKDAVNIPDQARVLFLDVEVQFDQPDELRAFIRQRASQ